MVDPAPEPDVMRLDEIDTNPVSLVGGKGAALAALARIDGVPVPPAFCVTSRAFERVVAADPVVRARVDDLTGADPDDRAAVEVLAAHLRASVVGVPVPATLTAAIEVAARDLGAGARWAVRSSATVEDSPTASFAGQHDSFLNIAGVEAVVDAVRRCWASLFTDRAIAYRARAGIDHREARMAVVVQRLVDASAAGVAFTADPVTSNRRVVAIEAVWGLGEGLVAGRAAADAFRVRDGAIVERTIATKAEAVRPDPGGGTRVEAVAGRHRTAPALTDDEVLGLAELARRIEHHRGHPVDLEWCLAGGGLQVVQSRPITTLFPVPEVDDDAVHVWISVGHQQMMTEAMAPLGISMWQATAARPMDTAGGRLFVDVTDRLASPATRAALVEGFARSDPLTGDALRTAAELVPVDDPPADGSAPAAPRLPIPGAPGWSADPVPTDPAIVTALVERSRASLAAAEARLGGATGPELLDRIVADIDDLRAVLFDPGSLPVIMAGMEAAGWLNEHLATWLGEKNAADTLTRSVDDNVTSEMGLALLDVADAIRPFPDVVEELRTAGDDGFLDALREVPGGDVAAGAIRAFLADYGMRCVGEIDLTRPRWAEHPLALVPVILGNLDRFPAGEATRRIEAGRRLAADKEREVLAALAALPDGEAKATETKVMIERVRTFAGYREYPKYHQVSRYFLYKRALLGEADRLVAAGVLADREDVFLLTLAEIADLVRTRQVDEELLARRRDELAHFRTLTPPRVLTSEGETLNGTYRRDDVPDGALVGLGVSTGVVEGRARVVLDMGAAELEEGDILVTSGTDPSWSPLFVAAAGLVTEVGGLMTHGAVIAREYGLPAVVGVERATTRLLDGQRIRIDGTNGFVELVEGDGGPATPPS